MYLSDVDVLERTLLKAFDIGQLPLGDEHFKILSRLGLLELFKVPGTFNHATGFQLGEAVYSLEYTMLWYRNNFLQGCFHVNFDLHKLELVDCGAIDGGVRRAPLPELSVEIWGDR